MAEDKRAYTVIGENDWNRWTRLMPSSPFSDRPEEYSERKVVWDARGELFIEILKAVSRDAVAAGKHPESITITVAHITEHAWREMGKRGWLVPIKRPDDA